MKKSTLAILSAIAIATAHGNHGVENVTRGESILWLQSELNLSNDTYREASSKIKAYKESCKTGEFKALKDSIATEVAKAEPSAKKLKVWNKELGKLSQAKAEAYSAHLIDLKTTLSPEEFNAFLLVSGKVYRPTKGSAQKPHSHDVHATEHRHEDGTVHAHEHDHTGDHAHSHDVHATEHRHEDGTVHAHEHDHSGDHAHSHDVHATEHRHEDGTVHAHEHDHSGDHAHSHDADKAVHTHENGTKHSH